MAANDTVRARIDPAVKKEAEAVLCELGLTLSDAIRMLMIRIAKDKALPLPVKVPNASLLAAMREADAIAEDRTRKRFATAEELFNDIENAARG